MDPDTRMVLASSRCSAPSGVSSSISALARHPFSGVRTCTAQRCSCFCNMAQLQSIRTEKVVTNVCVLFLGLAGICAQSLPQPNCLPTVSCACSGVILNPQFWHAVLILQYDTKILHKATSPHKAHALCKEIVFGRADSHVLSHLPHSLQAPNMDTQTEATCAFMAHKAHKFTLSHSGRLAPHACFACQVVNAATVSDKPLTLSEGLF